MVMKYLVVLIFLVYSNNAQFEDLHSPTDYLETNNEVLELENLTVTSLIG